MITLIGALIIVGVGTSGALMAIPPEEPSAAGPPSRETPPTTSAMPSTPRPDPPRFDRAKHSTTDPASIWVVVNKKRPIRSRGFRPEMNIVRGYQVARPAAGPLERLLAASDRAGVGFKIASAFRSFDYQQGVYASTRAARGPAAADRVSARPGHSEHQTGLAVDVVTPQNPRCDFDRCFADMPGGRWLTAHAWRFGFLIRYPHGASDVTGYSPEPWHIRYVGRPLAAEMRRTDVATMEEFFDIPGGGYR